jgi:hypothetical protein
LGLINILKMNDHACRTSPKFWNWRNGRITYLVVIQMLVS